MSIDDYLSHYGRIRDLVESRSFPEALDAARQFWLLSQGDPECVGVRVSFLLGRVVEIAREFPPAWDFVLEWRDWAVTLMGNEEKGSNARQGAIEADAFNKVIAAR